MELDIEKVKEAFALYSGEDMTESEDERYQLCARLCGECTLLVSAFVCDVKGKDELIPVAESWAAALAFYQLALNDEALSVGKVTADGVSVEPAERSKKAKMLADEKRRAVIPAIGEEAFYFGKA